MKNEFFQDGPRLGNTFDTDRFLITYLKTYMPAEVFQEIKDDLHRFGERCAGDILRLGEEAESNPPRLVPYDPWGRPLHHIETHRAWKDLDRVSAEEGLIAIAYERKFAEYSRPYQYAKQYLFHPSSAYYSCPLAMTDGAAKLIETHGDDELRGRAYKHLTSRSPEQFWTSGQWMTERTGGSDVSGSETKAERDGEDFRLYGTKWFTSATTSQMAMTLAREKNEKHLSLFYLELRDRHEALNNIEILRLKDKMGTKALPTAELRLNGTLAKRVGPAGAGVKQMATLFNVTRINNAVAAIGTARRALSLLMDYSERRRAFGKSLIDHPLHRETLAGLIADFHGIFLMAFKANALLGEAECGKPSATAEKLLRILTPLVKLFTAKLNLKIASEVVEGFGGAGYIEDVGIAKFLRDSQVLTIWEGTTNVLSLDLLRAIHKDEALPILWEDILQRLSRADDPGLHQEHARLENDVESLMEESQRFLGADLILQEFGARRLALEISKVYTRSLLLEFASRTKSPEIKASAQLWENRHQKRPLPREIGSEPGLLLKSW